MKEVATLARRFREVMLDGRWIANTNFKDQVESITLEEAQRVTSGLNSPLALCYHIYYYIQGINDFFISGKLEISDRFSFDHPDFQSDEQWKLFKEQLWNESEKFAKRVESMDQDQLDEVFVDPKYGTYKRNINGLIEHAYYHLGQLVLIRKLNSSD